MMIREFQLQLSFLRAGYYLGFYNKQLSYLNTPQLKNECLPAMKAIQYNSNFRLGTKAQDGVVEGGRIGFAYGQLTQAVEQGNPILGTSG